MSFIRSARARVALISALAAVLALALLVPATASSHREAPLITEDPVADNTDTYAFVSPENPDNTVLIANWIPFQEPSGGPNFYNFGEDVLYKINVDNDGDAVADLVYEWTFTSTFQNPDTFLYNTGPITSLDDENFNYRQTYTLSVVKDGQRTTLTQNAPVPPNNVGLRSFADDDGVDEQNYIDVANQAVTELPGGGTTFAGQRDEVFQIDLGSTFDLLGLRPLNAFHDIALEAADGRDATAGFNVHSIVLEVPTSELTQSADQPVIGVWSSTDRRRTRVFAGGSSAMPVASGPFTQVSRLGMPLVNEVVIPLGLKDTFNTLRPSQDAGALSTEDGSIPLVQDPEPGRLIENLYSESGIELPPTPRNDLVNVFLMGLPDLNQFPEGFQPAEYIRLNTSIPPTDFAEQSRLGAVGGPGPDGEVGTDDDIPAQLDGFPNGRRLIDDVTDIELRVVAGVLVDGFNVFPNNALTDGVDFNDKELLSEFPYIPAPFGGYLSTTQGSAESVTMTPAGPSNDGDTTNDGNDG
jgi:hypothetical protein